MNFAHTAIMSNTYLRFMEIQLTITLYGKLVVLFHGISTLFRSFNAELNHFDKSFKQFNLIKV